MAYIPLTTGQAPTQGTSGDAVKALQTQLNTQNAGQSGYTPLVVDGLYGPKTAAATAYKAPASTTPAPTTTGDTTTTPPKNDTFRPIYSENDTVTSPSVEDVQSKMYQEAQGQLNGLNNYYNNLINESKVMGEKSMRSTNAISTLTGLSGSSEAKTSADKTLGENKADLARIESERNAKIQEVLTGIRTGAVEEARKQREEARLSQQDRIANREKMQQEAVNHLTTLSKSTAGLSLEGIKATVSPAEYDYLIKNAGGEDMAKAIIFENRPIDSIIGTPQVIGGQLVQAYKTSSGAVRYDKVALPEGVRPDAMVEKTQNGILVSNDGGNTWKKVFGPGEGGSGSGAGSTADFAGTVDLVASMEGTVAGKEMVKNQLSSLLKNKDYTTAYNQIANTVENNLVGESKQRFANARTDLQVMGGLKSAIESYSAAGGDTGLLKGSAESIYRKLGEVKDPALTTLAVQLQREFQTYRNTMTGAAFTDKESAEYASVNPTASKKLNLNLSVVNGAMNQLQNRVVGTINTRVPSAQYIYEYATGADKKSTGSGSSVLRSPDGKQEVNVSELTPAELKEAQAAGWR
jgi:hypothetical protein